MTVSLRRAELADAPDLAVLALQLGYELDAGTVRARMAVLEVDHGLVVAVDEHGAVAGWMHLERTRALLAEPYLAVVVDERVRSRGIGARLLAHAEQAAREQGVQHLRLRSRSTRTRAHAFYRRAGWTETKPQLVFERVLGS